MWKHAVFIHSLRRQVTREQFGYNEVQFVLDLLLLFWGFFVLEMFQA